MKPATLLLDLSLAEPGMTLAEDVKDGRSTLLPKGTLLNENHLQSLARRGVAQLSVLAPVAAPRPEDIEAARRRLDYLFRRVGDDDVNRALQKAVLDFRSGGSR